MKTFIFGAGASIPFFKPTLDTAYLTDKVCCRAEWERMYALYSKYDGKNHQLVDIAIILQIIKEIKQAVPTVNFEQIAEIIDKISSWGFDKIPQHNMLNLLIYVLNTSFRPQNTNPFGIEWQDVPFLFRQIIAEAILDMETNHKAEGFESLISKQRNFIDAVCKSDEDISVISLNYDECLLDSLKGLGFEKGFRPKDDYNYGMQMDIKIFLEAKRVVYFPHGHLRFMFTDNDNVSYFSDSTTANRWRWENIDGALKGTTTTALPGKFASNYNTFISTGQTKDDGLNHLPYSVYYQRLAVDLYKSDTVYIIGYSFGDEHINRLLRSFINRDNENKVIVVDCYANLIDMTDTSEYSNSTLHKIHYYLGTYWYLTYSQAKGMMAANPQDIDNINMRGFGLLFPQVYYYKWGYESFLNQFNDILDIINL